MAEQGQRMGSMMRALELALGGKLQDSDAAVAASLTARPEA